MISEIDLKDWQQLPIRELYKARPRSYVIVPSMDNEVIFFSHIDGMYSYCVSLQNEIIHLAAWCEVIPLTKKDTDV